MEKGSICAQGWNPVLSSEDPSFSLVHLVRVAVSSVAQLEKGVLHSGPQRLNCFRLGFLPAVVLLVLRELLDPEDCNFINGLKQESTAG